MPPAIPSKPINRSEEFFMLRTGICLAAALLVAGLLNTASAQTTTAPAASAPAPAAKPSSMKLTADKLRDMKVKWSANKTKLKACRVEVKRRGLAGDDRWFFIEDCIDKT
jgi:hypothetical protein